MADYITSILLEVAHNMAVEREETKHVAAFYGIDAETSKRISQIYWFTTASVPWVGAADASQVIPSAKRGVSLAPTDASLAFGEFVRSIDFDHKVFEQLSAPAHSNYIRQAQQPEAEAFFHGIIAANELSIMHLIENNPEDIIGVGRMNAEGIDREYILAMLEIDTADGTR